MKMNIDFLKVNEYLKSQGLDPFPFDSINFDVGSDAEATEAAARYTNRILDWVSAQEAKGSKPKSL